MGRLSPLAGHATGAGVLVIACVGLFALPGGANGHRATECRGEPATIVGSSGNDVGDNTIEGTPSRDVIAARTGRDQIDGKGGNDLICGGANPDLILGSRGKDRIYGGTGGDVLAGGGANDKLLGEKGDDQLHGQKGFDLCDGGSGDDKASEEGCEKLRRASAV